MRENIPHNLDKMQKYLVPLCYIESRSAKAVLFLIKKKYFQYQINLNKFA